MGSKPHVLVVPFPAQGHVKPLMKFSNQIADYGIKVTIVNTEFIHEKIMAAMPENYNEKGRIGLVSIPDGLGAKDDRKDSIKVINSFKTVMPGHLKDLIQKMNHSNDDDDDERVTWLIADATIGWILEVGEKMGVKQAAIWPLGAGVLALLLHIPELVKLGIIDHNGTPMKNELISLSKGIPDCNSFQLTWIVQGHPELQKLFFECALDVKQTAELSKWLLCNTYHELESSACHVIPNILPIGPLLESDHTRSSTGSLCLEDSNCLIWLNEQPNSSVVYAAFGSTTIFSQDQFKELALGLELSGQRFLWVVRSDLANGSPAEYPDGFIKRVSDRGKIVEWAPQEKVLSHSSTALFLTHCGWNSIMEGLSLGVPFLCWPFFADQFHNRNYICDTWKVGLSLNPNESRIITRHEIKNNIEKLIADDAIKENALKLKEMAEKSARKGGSSYKNFESFIEHLKN